MNINDLEISPGAKKFLLTLGIDDVFKLLKIDVKSLQPILVDRIRYRAYFDEIYACIKGLEYNFNFETSLYYPYLNRMSDELEHINIQNLCLSPSFRKYFSRYYNLGQFFTDIAFDKKNLKRFLAENIHLQENYNWLFEMLHCLGNNGTILILNIYRYLEFLKQDKVNMNSLISKIIPDNNLVLLLNKNDIYFIGDLVKYSESSLLNLDGVGIKKIDIIKDSLQTIGLNLGMHPKNYYDFEFNLSSFDIRILGLNPSLENKVRSMEINNLDNLFFSQDYEFFTTSELLEIRSKFKKLGFDFNKGFLSSAVSSEVIEYNNMLLEYRLLKEREKELEQKLSGKVPMLRFPLNNNF